MANCFEQIIGIKGQCGEQTVPTSGLYVQDLPFMDLKTADALLSVEDSGVQFIKDRLNYAVNLVKADLNNRLMPYYRINSVNERGLIGSYVEQMTPVSGAAVYRGIQVKMYTYAQFDFILTSMALYSSNFTGEKTIKVFDLITGAELDSFEISLTAGSVTYFQINRKYFTNLQRFDIFICYDATGVDTWQTNIYPSQSNCITCFPAGGYTGNRYVVLNAGELPLSGLKIQSNLNYTNYTGGLSLQYSIACSNEAFMCSIKEQLAFPILHKWGVVMCDWVLNGTKRVNSVTTIDRDKAEALKPDFELKYQAEIDAVLRNLRFPNDLCFKCNQMIKTRVRIP